MSDIEIISHSERIEFVFETYRDAIGGDLPGYRNHVYRATTYAMHFLGGSGDHRSMVETAFAYHDIGLWTDRATAYLEPSEALALADNERFGWGLDPDTLRAAIHWHHKVFAYTGPNAEVVEACRKADWIDATQGTFRKGLEKSLVKAVEAALPNEGFHDALLRLAKGNGGSTVGGLMRVSAGIMKL
jgi:hypothetical protein